MKNQVAAALAALCLLAPGLGAQEKKLKHWTEWSKKDAEKILNDSPWGQTQTYTDTSEMTFQPTQTGQSQARDGRGATNQATTVKYRIRFFSARPIRQAFVRAITLGMKEPPDEQTVERLRSFAEAQPSDSIIIAVGFESSDGRFSGPALQAFNSATTATLKNVVYLERKDGRRLFLSDYVPPGPDGFGARFIFPRREGERDFITPETGEVRFFAPIAKTAELNMRFKVEKMLYNGALEY